MIEEKVPEFVARTYNVEVVVVIGAGDIDAADALAERIAADTKKAYAYRIAGGPDAVVANCSVESIIEKQRAA
jgi:hypothetical protein